MSLSEEKNKISKIDFSPFTNQQILEYFNFRCQICGSSYQVSNHHIIYKSQGGKNMPRLPLCDKCHISGIHDNPDFKSKYEIKLIRIALAFYDEVTNLKVLDF